MKIESIIRRPHGTKVEMGDKKYHFKPTEDDQRHTDEVKDPAHVSRFLSIPEGYRPADGSAVPNQSKPAAPAAPAAPLALFGSDKFDAVIDLAEGKQVQLGEVVRAAVADMELSTEEWNALEQDERDEAIRDQIDIMKADARDAKPEAHAVLAGSDWEPATVKLAEGVEVTTKDIAEAAFKESGLSQEDWNALPKNDIEGRMSAEVERRQTALQKPAPDVDKAALIAEAKALGIPATKNWGIPKLQDEIAKAKAGK